MRGFVRIVTESEANTLNESGEPIVLEETVGDRIECLYTENMSTDDESSILDLESGQHTRYDFIVTIRGTAFEAKKVILSDYKDRTICTAPVKRLMTLRAVSRVKLLL